MDYASWNTPKKNYKSKLNSTAKVAPASLHFESPFREQKKATSRTSQRTRVELSNQDISDIRGEYKHSFSSNKTNDFQSDNSFGHAESSNFAYDGNAARKIEVEEAPSTEEPKTRFRALKGAVGYKKSSTAALSPVFVSVAKIVACVVIFVALTAFARVWLTSATVIVGIDSNDIQNNISDLMIANNSLEVQNSALSNSSRIRQAAVDYKLVAPASISVIDVRPDILSYDSNNKVSLVESLNKVANIQK